MIPADCTICRNFATLSRISAWIDGVERDVVALLTEGLAEDAAVQRTYDGADGRTNPFLHLSMHLSISEQCSIDQPRGIRQAVELLAARRDSLHEAHHDAMDCLGQMLWESQRAGRPPDGQAYIDCVQRKATRD